MEWKVIYVGSAESQEHDQILEEVMVGPVPVGVNTFVLQAPAANHEAIPHDDILGVTVVLLTCSYLDEKFLQNNQEFFVEYDFFFMLFTVVLVVFIVS